MQVQVTSSAPTFGNCYIPQADIEGTELGSRAAAPLGMYYSSQQTIGVGFNCTFVTCSFLVVFSILKTMYCLLIFLAVLVGFFCPGWLLRTSSDHTSNGAIA